jgi:hypothetical protein
MTSVRDNKAAPILLTHVKRVPRAVGDEPSSEATLPVKAQHTLQDSYAPAPAEAASAVFLTWFHEFEAEKARTASAPLVRRMPVNPELLAREMQKKSRAG